MSKTMKVCTIEGCEKFARGGRGWCQTHWKRWRNHGDPLVARTYGQGVWARVVEQGECWTWTGAANPEGYGRIWHNGRLDYTHRVAYREMVGEIPEGLELDHLCRTPLCVRPDHLEPVSKAENRIREGAAKRAALA